MKKITGIIIGVLVVFLVLSSVKDTIIRITVEKGMRMVTGLRLDIRSLKVGILSTHVDIQDLQLFNPSGYNERIMVDMPRIYVDYYLMPLFKRKIHLKEVHIDLKKFVVEKNFKGELNLNFLRVVKHQEKEKTVREREKAGMPEIQIDHLKLKIGKAVYKDYSKGGEPTVREFDLNLDEEYNDIDQPYELASLIVVRALANTTISKLANFDLSGLQGTISNTLGSAGKMAAKTAAEAQKTIKETAGNLMGALKLPFGNKEEE